MELLYEQLNRSPGFFLIAGPCVVEDYDSLSAIASALQQLCADRGITLVFKASYKKANRSSGDSFAGLGQQEGLRLLEKIKASFGLLLLTDVHECAEVAAAAEVCDILQVPAFLSRQTELIQACARSGRIVNIKKGQFMAPEDMQGAAQKAVSAGNAKILLTERGSSFGYHDLVVDFRGFALLRSFGYPVIYDVTHSLQRPSLHKTSGGNPEYAALMARAALATGKVQGLFLETHPEPENAKSDAASMLPLSEMAGLLDGCIRIMDALKGRDNG